LFARSISILLTDHSALWMFLICACTLITELTSLRNRPLIPAPAASYNPWGIGAPEYCY
jgi:hypothetical protein